MLRNWLESTTWPSYGAAIKVGVVKLHFCLQILMLSLPLIMMMACSPLSGNSHSRREATDMSINEEFHHFSEVYGGVNSLGQPLTEIIIVDGWHVQYFENGRLEYHPENEPAYRVTVGWLGDLLQRRRPPINSATIPGASPNSHYFAETGHTLSGDFLTYFDAHGGSVRFGQPISEPFILNGQLTQDLQSARFFWTPQTDPPVTLEHIGRVHLDTISGQNKE